MLRPLLQQTSVRNLAPLIFAHTHQETTRGLQYYLRQSGTVVDVGPENGVLLVVILKDGDGVWILGVWSFHTPYRGFHQGEWTTVREAGPPSGLS